MKTYFIGLLLLVSTLAGCPSTCGEVTRDGGPIDCSIEKLQEHIGVIPKVNDCLLSANAFTCLDLLPTTVGVGIDVVLCFVQDQGDEARAAAAANPEDELSKKKAETAKAYLEEKNAEFTSR